MCLLVCLTQVPTPTTQFSSQLAELEAIVKLSRSDPMTALRQAAALRANGGPSSELRRAVDDALERTLLPAVRGLRRVIPHPVAVSQEGVPEFSGEQLERYEPHMEHMREIQALVGNNMADRCLGLTRLMQDLTAAAVNRALQEGGPDAARRWMISHGVHDPLLAVAIDQAEAAAAAAAATASSGASHRQRVDSTAARAAGFVQAATRGQAMATSPVFGALQNASHGAFTPSTVRSVGVAGARGGYARRGQQAAANSSGAWAQLMSMRGQQEPGLAALASALPEAPTVPIASVVHNSGAQATPKGEGGARTAVLS